MPNRNGLRVAAGSSGTGSSLSSWTGCGTAFCGSPDGPAAGTAGAVARACALDAGGGGLAGPAPTTRDSAYAAAMSNAPSNMSWRVRAGPGGGRVFIAMARLSR